MSKEEYRPQPSKQPEQHKPQQEGGTGAPGIPPVLQERAQPPPEGSAYGGRHTTSMQEPQPETETVPAPAKRPRGRPRTLDDPLAWENYYKKKLESNRAYKKKLDKDKVNEQRRRRYKERKEQGRLPSRKQPPKQVYPSPPEQD
jgi:hypothetical protein